MRNHLIATARQPGYHVAMPEEKPIDVRTELEELRARVELLEKRLDHLTQAVDQKVGRDDARNRARGFLP